MAKVNKWMIDPQDAVMLLIDHQSGYRITRTSLTCDRTCQNHTSR